MKYNPDVHHRKSIRLKEYDYSKEGMYFKQYVQKIEKTYGQIIRGLKAGISKIIGYSIWQRNYYEHIIRNEEELYKIIEYIKYNPLNWDNDSDYKI